MLGCRAEGIKEIPAQFEYIVQEMKGKKKEPTKKS